MKNKMTQLRQAMIMAASLVLLSGIFYAVPAGQGHHSPGTNRVVTQDTGVAGSPAPVVDDTPINPDTIGKIKSVNSPKNVKHPPKKLITPR